MDKKTLTLVLFFHVLCYALALPLVGWKWLIFPALALAVIPVVCTKRRLPGRHPYLKLWLFGTIFWTYVAHFVRYPHWMNYGLMLALGAYLGCYLPLFTTVSRRLIHERLPRWLYPVLGRRVFTPSFRTLALLLVVTLTWAACDVLRGWVFSGFMMGSVADVFYRDPLLIQTADIFGQWGVSALILFLSATGVTLFYPGFSKKVAVSALIFGLAFWLGYGKWRLGEDALSDPVGNIALIQGAVPAELETTPELVTKTEEAYLRLIEKVRKRAQATGNPADLVIMPECIYRYPVYFSEPNAFQPSGMRNESGELVTWSQEEYQARVDYVAQQTQNDLIQYAHYVVQAPLLTGCSTFYYRPTGIESYNSAIYVGMDTQRINPEKVYHKMILVPFGEYIPTVKTLRKWMPSLDSYFPITSQDAGKHARLVEFHATKKVSEKGKKGGETLRASLSICFETVLGRLTRRQIMELRRNETEPDLIINLTNNGWFRHSHETELHLACGVFRAVENRKPILISANYGISASIDSCGHILDAIPTGEEDIRYASIQRDSRQTFFTTYGGILLWIPLSTLVFSFFPMIFLQGTSDTSCTDN